MNYIAGKRAVITALIVLATFASVATAQTSLPSPWVLDDIGNPAVAGIVSVSSGTFTITAEGADIWGTSDQFSFVYQPMTGDGELVARVAGVTSASSWSKAGVMMRETLTSGSKHAFALVSAGKGVAFQQRTSTGGSSTNIAGSLSAAPRWVRLVRSGNSFQAYESADGQTWQSIGSVTISMASTIYVGLAVTSHNTSATTTATISNVAVRPVSTTSGPVPAPWTSEDVGAPAVSGSASYDSTTSTFTVAGAGSDIWGSADQFHFVHQLLTGDGVIVARVQSIGAVKPWSKAGVMIREDLSAGSKHAMALASASKGNAFQRRLTTGGTSLSTAGSLVATPYWVKLVRTGDVFDAYEAPDGATWKLIGSETIAMLQTVYVGLAVTSHDATTATTALFTNVKVTTSSTTNQPPTVAITSPTSGATFTAPATVTLSASASDPDGTVSKVAFYQGTTLIGTATTAPYSVSWTNVAAGTYSLTAVATDNSGATTTSSAISITVNSSTNKPPTVAITSPASGATFTAPATIAISASASDSDGTVSKVAFYQGTTLIGTATAAPYSASWTNVAAGTYSLTAVATDNSGATTTSAAVSVTVNASTNKPPTVAITSPVAGAAFSSPTTVAVTASASDADGTVAKVAFYAGSTLIGTSTTSPYGVNWANAAPGTYSLTAVATDNSGASTTSAAVSVTLNPSRATFNISTDDAIVTSYRLDIFPSGADPNTATPVASQSLGKPTPVNGVDTVDITATLVPLAPGTYIATVSAIDPSGSARSTAVSFVR